MGTDLKKVRPAADTNLINGKMNFDCSNSTTGAKCTNNAGVSKFQFTSGKKHKLRLINTGTAGIQKFSIDNHKLSVIANDMIQIQPYTTEIVTLAVSRTFHQRALWQALENLQYPDRSKSRCHCGGCWQARRRILDAI